MNESSNPIVIKKLNQDDILEIVIEHFWKNDNECKNLLSSKAIALGIPGKDLRVICVFGELGDIRIRNCDIAHIDEEIDYNGDHSV